MATAVAGEADVLVTGDADLLAVQDEAPLPILEPRRVQLQRQDGYCWEATYSEAHTSKNDEYPFKGKAD